MTITFLNWSYQNSFSEKLTSLDTSSQDTTLDVDALELSLSASGSRYGRTKAKQEADVEMEDLRLVYFVNEWCWSPTEASFLATKTVYRMWIFVISPRSQTNFVCKSSDAEQWKFAKGFITRRNLLQLFIGAAMNGKSRSPSRSPVSSPFLADI